jgi:hypothetical protein
MAVEREALRDWHRLFGLLLTDFFSGSPFAVEVERDLSQQQQFLDVVIVRRRRGKFTGALPDGLGDLAEQGFAVSYTMRDFWRDFVKEHLPELTPEEREDVLKALPPEERLAGLSAGQIRQDLARLSHERPAKPRKPRREK